MLSLFKIILDKKYLNNNDDRTNNIAKMKIIEKINNYLKNSLLSKWKVQRKNESLIIIYKPV